MSTEVNIYQEQKMQQITDILGTKICNGFRVNIVRNYFIYEPARDYCKETHKHFSKEEKKLAKWKYKEANKLSHQRVEIS